MGETRELGEQEWLLHFLHRIGGLIAVQALHVRGPLDPDRVREALHWLQTQHPILRAHIEYGRLVFINLPPFVYRQPSFVTDGTTEIPLAIVDNPDPEHWRTVLARELSKPIKRGKHPRLRVTLVRQSPESDLTHIVICADHATLDAQSGNMLGRQFMEFLADPAAMLASKPVHTTLPPPLEAGLPAKPDSGTRGYMPAIRLPNRPLPNPKMQTRILSRRLEADTTVALKAAIKANRTTLHGAVTAAFLSALRARYELDEMTVLTTIDLRRLMKPALHAETYGCYIDILRTKHALGDDFWAMARDASFRLITSLAKDQKAASILKLFNWEVYGVEMKGIRTHRRRIDGLAITTAGESGLRRHYGQFELVDVSMAVSLDTFGPSLFAIASEREGGIDLSIGYTAFAMSDEEATAITEAALVILEAAR
ncbi:MAG: hypothetical protein EOP22_17690 [Hyphomicrobiales bacterium]|nr:MAG: hypothetical protein EOP22_17690 [Hyphomicrobiales bacterium]